MASGCMWPVMGFVACTCIYSPLPRVAHTQPKTLATSVSTCQCSAPCCKMMVALSDEGHLQREFEFCWHLIISPVWGRAFKVTVRSMYRIWCSKLNQCSLNKSCWPAPSWIHTKTGVWINVEVGLHESIQGFNNLHAACSFRASSHG